MFTDWSWYRWGNKPSSYPLFNFQKLNRCE